jgi:nucleotide-binding universal stress UspA family protein
MTTTTMVLLATDGSPGATAATTLLRRLLPPDTTDVLVVSAATGRGRRAPATWQAAEATAEAAESELRGAGLRVSVRVVEGDPQEVVPAVALEIDADLVVLGGDPHRRFGRPGSVSRAVSRHTDAPVLMAHTARDDDAPPRVVLGVSGSRRDTELVDLLGRIVDPARCEIVVVAVAMILAPTLRRRYATDAPPEVLRAASAAPRSHAEAAAARLRDQFGFHTDRVVVAGEPGATLVTVAAERGACLVAVGCRGLSWLPACILQSTSRHVLASAPATLVLWGRPGPGAAAPRSDDAAAVPPTGLR